MIDTTMRTPAPSYFHGSYRQSRETLLEKARSLGNQLPLMIDSRTLDIRGPEQETLALDFLIFGARKPRHALGLKTARRSVAQVGHIRAAHLGG